MNRNIRIRQSIAEGILGTPLYLGFLSYVLEALRRCLSAKQKYNNKYYLVGMTRRCYVMWWDIFFEILEKKSSANPEEIYYITEIKNALLNLCNMPSNGNFKGAFKTFVQEHFITDTVLFSMVDSLLDEYVETKHIPYFIILDELLIHGRGLNGTLFHIEQSLISGYKKSLSNNASIRFDEAKQSIQDSFLHSIDIWIYAENKNQHLLLKRYADRMQSMIRCSPSQWRSLSLRFGQLVSVGKFSNIGFSWSIEHKAMPPQPVKTKNFQLITTHLQNVEQRTYICFYPDQEAPRVVATIRFKENAEGELLCVPYIMYGSLSWTNVSFVHKHLCFEAKRQNKKSLFLFLSQNSRYDSHESEERYIRWTAETTDLILSSFLMKKFAKEVAGCTSWKDYKSKYIKTIRYDPLLPNYRLHIQKCGKNNLDVADTAIKQLWQMDLSLEDLLADLTAGKESFLEDKSLGAGLWTKELKTTDLPIDSPLVFAVEDSIAQIGMQAERNAFDRFYTSSIFNDIDLTNWGKSYSLSTLLDVFQDVLGRYKKDLEEKPNLYQFVAVLTQAMDLGLLGMSTVPQDTRDNLSNSEMEVYTRQRAGEAALFILPIRYRFFLKDLGYIVNKCENDEELIARKIDDLVNSLPSRDNKDNEEWQIYPHKSPEVMKQCLIHFVRMLLTSGQTFDDWNIALNDFSAKYKHSFEHDQL